MRRRMPRAKPGELKAQWGDSREQGEDIYLAHGEGIHRSDAHLLYGALCTTYGSALVERSLIDELERRGYDITTLKFSIQKKVKHDHQD